MRARVGLCIACHLALHVSPGGAQSPNATRVHADTTPILRTSAGRSPFPAASLPGRILPTPVMFDSRIGHQNQGLKLPVPDNSLWFRYYKAGEEADLRHETGKAKKYWMASLAELEKVAPNPSDDLMSVKLSALEIGLISTYPKDWTTLETSQQEQEHLRDEQVKVFYRMAVINSRLVPGDTLLCSKSKERYEIVKKENEKALLGSKNRANR